MCGSLNVIDLHKLIGVALFEGIVVGLVVALLEEVYHWGDGL